MTPLSPGERRRVLVTGGTGFLGRHLVRNLAETGNFRLRLLASGAALDDLPAAARPISEIVTSDGADPREACAGVDAVIHLADTVTAAASVDATLTLALRAADAGVRRFVLLSGAGVGDVEPLRRGPRRAAAILVEEGLAELAARTGLATVILRPCLMAGEGQTGGALLTLFRLCRRGLFPVVDDLAASRAIVDVEDVARALILALDHGTPGRIYPVTSGVHHELGEVLAVAGALVGSRRPYLRLPQVAGRWTRTAGDALARRLGRAPPWSDDFADLVLGFGRVSIEPTRRELDYAPHYRDLRAMLARTYAWFGMSGQL